MCHLYATGLYCLTSLTPLQVVLSQQNHGGTRTVITNLWYWPYCSSKTRTEKWIEPSLQTYDAFLLINICCIPISSQLVAILFIAKSECRAVWSMGLNLALTTPIDSFKFLSRFLPAFWSLSKTMPQWGHTYTLSLRVKSNLLCPQLLQVLVLAKNTFAFTTFLSSHKAL